MYDNVVKYSWHILNIVKKEEDKLYVRVASDISDKTADCNIHIYPNGGSLDDSDSVAYNFVLCFRDSEGYNAGTVVGVLEKVADAAHVLDCLLATNDAVYPSITLPPSRCEYDNDILGHYFYLLVDQLYHMTAF